jgi:hypothetical protein
MKSITIHDLDETTGSMIKERSRKWGLSLNKTIKLLLGQSLGTGPGIQKDNTEEFLDLCGVWSEAQYREFNKSAKHFRKVDANDWK